MHGILAGIVQLLASVMHVTDLQRVHHTRGLSACVMSVCDVVFVFWWKRVNF